MDTALLLRGIIIGLSIAAPVGPIGVLCIRRTLADGRAAGLVSGLGAATADALYGAVAGFGLTLVADFLAGHSIWLRLLGGAFLLYLGARTLRAQPSERAASAQGGGLLGAYASTFFLTLTNPTTIFSFMLVFAGLGLASAGASHAAALVLVAGVFAGSALWWLLLSGGVGLLRARFDARAMRWVNRVAGAVIATFGIVALASLFVG